MLRQTHALNRCGTTTYTDIHPQYHFIRNAYMTRMNLFVWDVGCIIWDMEFADHHQQTMAHLQVRMHPKMTPRRMMSSLLTSSIPSTRHMRARFGFYLEAKTHQSRTDSRKTAGIIDWEYILGAKRTQDFNHSSIPPANNLAGRTGVPMAWNTRPKGHRLKPRKGE